MNWPLATPQYQGPALDSLDGGRRDFEEERIAEAGEILVLRRLDDGLGEFFPGEEIWVFAGGEELCLAEIVMAVAECGAVGGDGFDAGIDDGGGAVVVDGAAGEAAVGVVAAGSGSERDWEMAPVNHVVADGVIPVHVAPDGGVGIVLEEHVVLAAPVDGAVGVVHPVLGGEEVELGAERIGGEFGGECVAEEICGAECGESCCGGGGFQEVAAGV